MPSEWGETAHYDPDSPAMLHCYHCGRLRHHRTWCPDRGSAPDSGLVGFWYYSHASNTMRCHHRL